MPAISKLTKLNDTFDKATHLNLVCINLILFDYFYIIAQSHNSLYPLHPKTKTSQK